MGSHHHLMITMMAKMFNMNVEPIQNTLLEDKATKKVHMKTVPKILKHD